MLLNFKDFKTRLTPSSPPRAVPVVAQGKSGPLAAVPPKSPSSKLAIENYDDLYNAVQARLKQHAGERFSPGNQGSAPSRSRWRERLAGAEPPADSPHQAFALLCVNLDGCKEIYDLHGGGVGDELLRIVATRLSRAVRTEDMVGRVGDCEFACLLSGSPSRVELVHLACKLFDVVETPLQIGPLKLMVHPSIGIAMGPDHGATAYALVNSAYTATHRAKAQMTGYAFFEELADA
jgi:diguanylate cyclase (GGDEF)-like protein